MENTRTVEAAARMKSGDVERLGALMNASHISLRDDYEVSCEELDLMVELATMRDGCLGARRTGADFGGCAIALVEAHLAEGIGQFVAEQYARKTGIIPEVYLCQAANGAELIQ